MKIMNPNDLRKQITLAPEMMVERLASEQLLGGTKNPESEEIEGIQCSDVECYIATNEFELVTRYGEVKKEICVF